VDLRRLPYYLAWVLFRRPSVMTRDHDGDVRYRLVRYEPWSGTPYVFGLGRCSERALRSDGTISNSYVVSWRMLYGDEFRLYAEILRAETRDADQVRSRA
jgi:hypothetical protein